MEEIDLSKELQEFYEQNKDNNLLLSNEEVKKKSRSMFNSSGFNKIRTSYINETIFGLKVGVVFTKNGIISSKHSKSIFLYDEIVDSLKITEGSVSYLYKLRIKRNVEILINKPEFRSKQGFIEDINLLSNFILDVSVKVKNHLKIRLEKEKLELEQKRLEQKRLEQKRLKELQVSQTNVLSELDKDGNGEVDVVEGNDFNTLLKKHQKSIVEVDRNYVKQFVKVSSYLKTKKGNIQSIFNSIKDTPNQEVLNEYVEILKDEIHTYNLVLFNSLNMIVSLVEDDMITFYEIHEMFDTLNMFDSKHEKDVSQKLTNIGDGLENLMYEIRDMGNQISNSIQELSYVTEESNRQLTNQLSEIDSTMKVGNLISTINTYQNYKNNKNTKNLRG
jgi:hypothetical protein